MTSGIIDIKYICPVRGSHNAVIGVTCPWSTENGENVNSHSWLNAQVTTYIQVHNNDGLVWINWRWWGSTLKNSWRETISVCKMVDKNFAIWLLKFNSMQR